jgi:hypothetical protein
MKFSSIGLISLGAAFALTSFVSAASATVAFDADLASGWTQGTGTSNGNFAVDTEANGVELGLRATLRNVGNITPVDNVYTAPAGIGAPNRALWNFDFSVNPGTVGDHSLLTITGPGGTFALNLQTIFDNTPGGPLYQNSENLGFNFLSVPLNFDPFATGLYTFDLQLFDANNTQLGDVSIQVNAVPEPSTWAMLILGFIGIGFVSYRRRITTSLTPA